jgi:predicted nucleotidyltransferase
MRVTETSEHLRALARRIAAAHVEETEPRAALLVGSAARGVADRYSDLDLILYYDELPSDEAIGRVRERLGGRDVRVIHARSDEGYAESFRLGGAECQLGFTPIPAWETELDRIFAGEDLESPLPKVLDALLAGIPLHGAETIERWRDRARAYPDELRRRVVEHHWRFFPLWYFEDRVAARDAVLWRQQILVDAAFDLLAVLAALNRLWFSSFELKRMRALTDRMRIAPPNLAERVERLFEVEPRAAGEELEALVRETRELVAAELPELDLSLRKPLGERERPWAPASG